MVERYAREAAKRLWSKEAKFEAWLKVEKSVVRGWNALGVVDDESCEEICQKARLDIARMEEIEKITKHDLIAFTTAVAESLGESSRWFHYGITSSDTIDTAAALQMRDSVLLIIDDIVRLREVLRAKALRYKDTLMVGRSHGIHGEPTTFGLVLALWYEEIGRHLEAFRRTLNIVAVGKISGAMGNMAHSPIALEEFVCRDLGLDCALVSNQIIQRDRYARLFCDIALLASSCEKIAVALRHFQRTEVYECEEFFSAGQKGSSAMPHKRNPILSENITGLCRVLRSYATPALENVALWHERDISHSAVERFILPDAFVTLDFMLARLSDLLENLVVYEKNMMKNLALTGGLVFSQRVLLELPKKGVSREDAYKIVQRNAMKVWEGLQNGGDGARNGENEGGGGTKNPANAANPANPPRDCPFLRHLLADAELMSHLSEEAVRECFDYGYFLKNVDGIFRRVFRGNF